ncbi:MAG: alpha-2-macroglobulin family protein [Crocinitomicaceae bacterium]
MYTITTKKINKLFYYFLKNFKGRSLILIGIFICFGTFAQPAIKANYSNYLKVYKLNQQQYHDLNKYQAIHDSLKLFTNFVKNIPLSKSKLLDSLPSGHYLTVRAMGGQINFKVHSNSYFKLQSHGYNGEIWHIITDLDNKVLKEASISIKDKIYTYQKDCNCYPVSAKAGTDTVLVTYQNHYEYFKVSNQFNSPDDYEETSNTYKHETLSDIRILPGYVAFNQPMYRKNDTVRVKAFLVNEKGKVWKKRKVIAKYTTPEGKTIVLGKIKRQSEGAYVTEFVVPEKFKLGSYNLTFWTSWDEVKLRSELFKIKDYELQPENTYASNTTQSLYYRGQDIQFLLKAQDVNGLPLLDAKARVTIQAIQFLDFYDKFYYWSGKPNFLKFEKEVLFDLAGETVLSFSDSLFPNTKTVYRATIQYYNDLGNLYSNQVKFTFDGKRHHFEFRLMGDTITANYFTYDKSTPYKKMSLLSMRDNDTVDLKIVNAPYKERIDLFNTLYILKDENGIEIDRITLNQNKKIPISVKGKRSHDSIQIQLINKLQMPVSYQIFKRDRKVKGGQWKKGDTPIIYNAQDVSLDDYHVFYSVLWRNKHFINEQIFYLDETKLNVNINQPDIVFPGSKVPVEVNITDYKNRGVEGANITAYSVNNLFENIPNPNLPYFGRLHKGFLNQFNVQQGKFRINRNIMLTAKHLEQFNLKETPYYAFAYAKDGIGVYQDSIGGEMAEIACFATNMNSRVDIHAVYLDDKPVAINGSSNMGVYTFLKPAGTYNIKLRTASKMYTIKNVQLIKGEKTFLCLNEAFIEENSNVTYLNIDDAPFTKVEWNYLKPNFMYLTKGTDNYVLEQDGILIDIRKISGSSAFYDNGHWYYFIGPLKEGKVNIFNQTKDTLMSFDFYPGYLYSIDSIGQVVIDRPAPETLSSEKYSLNTQRSDWNFNYKLRRWADFLAKPDVESKKKETPKINKQNNIPPINYDNPARFKQLKSFRPRKNGSSAINLKNNSGKSIYWVVCNHQKLDSASGAWYTSRFNYNGFSPGIYDIMILYSDSTYSLIKDFNVKGSGTNFYRLDSNEVKAPNHEIQTFYEEIIVEGNKSPLRKFINSPQYFEKINLKTTKNKGNQTVLSGFVISSNHQPINGMNLIFEIEGKFKYGALTNADGYFELKNVVPGTYTIKMGNSLPYQVYEGLAIKGGVKTRIVIGDDPLVRLNGNGEIEIDERYNQPLSEPVSVYASGGSASYTYTDNISASTINAKNIQYAPAFNGNNDLQAVLISTAGTVQVYETSNTIETESYPSLEPTETTNKIKAFAKKNGLDKATMELIRQSDSLNRIRDNFRDYGYWVPNMVTDVNGYARFTVQFPDNITSWKTIVPAMTGNKQTGIGVKYAQSFKPLSAHLGIPSFLVVGDSIELEGKVLNYTNDSASLETWFKLNNDTLQSSTLSTRRTIAEQYRFSCSNPDSILLGYELKMSDGYLDGEERELSVLTDEIEQVKGSLFLMDQDSVLSLSAANNKRSIYVYNKPLEIYESEINKLKAYKYGCNEQTASKLKALLLEEKIANALEKPFKGANTIRACIRILEKNQMPNGSYGWWGRSPYKLWVSAYVLDALNKASKTYKVNNYMLTARMLKSDLDNMTVSNRLTVLNTLTTIPFPMDYKSHIKHLDTVNLSLQDEFKLIYLKQNQNIDVSIDQVLNTFIEKPEGVFWGEALFKGYINVWETSALAYKIMRNEGNQNDLMTKMRDYFLQLNPEGRNTIQRATLLELFLEDELVANQTASAFKGDVWINNRKIESFPYFQSFNENEVINIRKSGKRVRVQVNTHSVSKNPSGNDSLLNVNASIKQLNYLTDTLVAGKPIVMTVTVEVKEKMNYVLLEIPIPATCIYNSQKARKNNLESYREEFRHMTAISCSSLPKGKHQFKINLIPRYEGQFKMLPVKVEEMYFPVNVNYSKARVLRVVK